MALMGGGGPNVTCIDSGGHRERVRARRDELVCEHMDLVRVIARRIHASLPPSFELDDLYAEGYRALIDLATRYRPAEHGGAPFSAFARPRIRGAIMDSVTGRHYTEATRDAFAEEPAAETTDRVEAFDRQRRLARIDQAISRIAPAQAEVVRLYYSPAAPTFQAIGRVMRKAESTVQKLHWDAIARLRSMLGDTA